MTSDDYTPEELRLADRLAWMNNMASSDRESGVTWTMEMGARWLIEHGVGFTDAAHDAGVRADQAEKDIAIIKRIDGEFGASNFTEDNYAAGAHEALAEVLDILDPVALTPTTEETEQ